MFLFLFQFGLFTSYKYDKFFRYFGNQMVITWISLEDNQINYQYECFIRDFYFYYYLLAWIHISLTNFLVSHTKKNTGNVTAAIRPRGSTDSSNAPASTSQATSSSGGGSISNQTPQNSHSSNRMRDEDGDVDFDFD